MKKFILASTAALLLGTVSANAESYVSVLGGPTWDPAITVGAGKQGTDTGFNAGARYGYGLDGWGLKNFAAEADFLFNQSHFTGTNARLQSASYMGNLIYRVPTGSPFSLYGGAGAGLVSTNYDDGVNHGGSDVLGWQALGGVEYRSSENTSMFVEYRYQNAHNANAGVPNVGNTSNNLSVGVKFHM